ncbi:MAG: hypothetical protein PHG13_01115 [Candidatus Pacebacteria bacterium]|nr:hypothetical protein [Candidatus Paceibacterota bacterium]MDD5721989.1 hypothetical protein [Candidatus Paceibacterota bacterium]
MKKSKFLIILLAVLLFIVLQAEAKGVEKYKISFTFCANDSNCVVKLRDPLGELSYNETLKVTPLLVEGKDWDIFLPLKDLVRIMGGFVRWCPRNKEIEVVFQGDQVFWVFSLIDYNSEILILNRNIMVSTKLIIENLVPSEVFRNKALKMIILTWPLS